jgi:transglutaminase-like putative cysteine protease
MLTNRPVTLGALYGATRTLKLSGAPDDQTAQTIAAMFAFVHDTDRSQLAHRVAVALASKVPQKDFRGQLRAVYEFVLQRVRFKRDTFDREHLRHPDQLLSEILATGSTAADCDDASMLGAALVRALGMPPVFITMARGALTPYEHVYFGAELDGQIVPMDPQERTPFGQHTPPASARRRVWSA